MYIHIFRAFDLSHSTLMRLDQKMDMLTGSKMLSTRYEGAT